MSDAIFPRRIAVVLAAAVFPAVAAVLPARAADASAWDGDARSSVRLIAGSQANGAALEGRRAGIEIKLDAGWKTYWRYPGDSGVPPRFDFARSENIETVALAWPAPRSFSDGSGSSIGYAGNVIFPLRIVPKDPAKPVVLRLDVDYAICEKLCVPAQGRAELVVSDATSSLDGALAASEARVPKPVRIGEGGPLAVTAVSEKSESHPRRVVVDVMAPEGAPVELFAEGPAPDWALPIPEVVPGAPAGTRRFAFDLDGLPPGASPAGATVKLTAVSAGAAIEVEARLD